MHKNKRSKRSKRYRYVSDATLKSLQKLSYNDLKNLSSEELQKYKRRVGIVDQDGNPYTDEELIRIMRKYISGKKRFTRGTVTRKTKRGRRGGAKNSQNGGYHKDYFHSYPVCVTCGDIRLYRNEGEDSAFILKDKYPVNCGEDALPVTCDVSQFPEDIVITKEEVDRIYDELLAEASTDSGSDDEFGSMGSDTKKKTKRNRKPKRPKKPKKIKRTRKTKRKSRRL